MFTLDKSGAATLVRSQLLHECGCTHGFTTRLGGVSKPPFESLNMAFHTGDVAERVVENRRRACAALGCDLAALVAGEQVHGAAWCVVTAAERGRGAFDMASAIPGTDVLVTNTPGILLASFYADCVPVMLADPVQRAVGIAHCGWRGTLAAAPRIALEAMQSAFGTDPRDVRVVIGPSIGPCCYEVAPDLAAQFCQQFGADVALGRQLDLRLANLRTVCAVGVLPEHVHIAPWCTSCETGLFYSHRAEGGKTGRMAALIGYCQDSIPN